MSLVHQGKQFWRLMTARPLTIAVWTLSALDSLAEDSVTSSGIKREEMTEQWWHTASALLGRNHLNPGRASAGRSPFMWSQTLKEVMLFFLYVTAHFDWASCPLGKGLWLFQQTNISPFQPAQITSIRKGNQPGFKNIPRLLLLW